MSSNYHHRGIAWCCSKVPEWDNNTRLTCLVCGRTAAGIGDGFPWVARQWNESFPDPMLWMLPGYRPCVLTVDFEYWGRTVHYGTWHHAAFKTEDFKVVNPSVVSLWVYPDIELEIKYPSLRHPTSSVRVTRRSGMFTPGNWSVEIAAVQRRDQKQLEESLPVEL